MTQEERRIWLIRRLFQERPEYRGYAVPKEESEQKDLLRGLMNLRMPDPLEEEVLRVQDDYLSARNGEKGVVSLSDIPEQGKGISLWQGDITRLAVDAIVNAANAQMLGCFIPMHTCIDNCIHTYAGMQLRAECYDNMQRLRARFGPEYEQPTAVPMLTNAYNLPAKKVIHVVGPIVEYGLTAGLEQDLADCYRNVLDLCGENGLKSVAFCCISTGVFRFPNQRAAEIAVDTVQQWLRDTGYEIRVIFNVFKDQDLKIYQRLLQ